MTFADVLRSEGVAVHEVDGWQSRQRPGEFTPAGVLFHHTAGLHALDIIVNGRSDLAGPLADIYLDKQGVAHVVSDGRCNHAGRVAGIVVARIRNDKPPVGTASSLGLVDDTDGNRWFYGVEMENLGDGVDPWPVVQLDAAARIGAALCRASGWTANRCAGHLEVTRRKPDPRGFPMSSLRALVAQRLTTSHQEDDMTPAQAKLLEQLAMDVASIKAELFTGDAPPVGALVAETNERTKRQGTDLGKIKAALKVDE